MPRRFTLAGLILLLGTATLHADILPEPDQGPRMATVCGLAFSFQTIVVTMPPGYQKSHDVVILSGCEDGTANCALARRKNLIGMQVLSVDGHYLQPVPGEIQMILDAFADKHANGPVMLELYSRETDNNTSLTLPFVRH
jgi:hypothetical protein